MSSVSRFYLVFAMARTVCATRHCTNGYSNHRNDFIERLKEWECQKLVKKMPRALNVAQRAALREQLKEVHFLKLNYAARTKINIAGILRIWKT